MLVKLDWLRCGASTVLRMVVNASRRLGLLHICISFGIVKRVVV